MRCARRTLSSARSKLPFDKICNTVCAESGIQDMKSIALVLSVCIGLSACAAKQQIADERAAVNAEPGRALVVGFGSTAAENARAALTPQQGTRVSSLFVAKANQQKMSFGQNVARLTPGTYELTVACGLYIDYRYFPQNIGRHSALRDGHVSRLRADPQGRRCEPYLEDVAETKRR